MSSLGSATSTGSQFTQTDFSRNVGVGQVQFAGSFQGFLTSTANYLPAQSRGSNFSVSWVATGQYRVKIVGMVPNDVEQPRGVADGSLLPGNPKGMWVEPRVNVLSETVASLPTITRAVASRLDHVTPGSATYNTFDVFTFNSAGTATDIPVTERCQFWMVYKSTEFAP